MNSLRLFLLLALPIFLAGELLGNESEKGWMDVYPMQFQGRATASGEVYAPNALTAAHVALPFGTMVRVANFETGRMVDVRINDRKPRDGGILRVSAAAGQQLGIPTNRAVQGSMMVLGMAQHQVQQTAQAKVQPYTDRIAADPRYHSVGQQNGLAQAGGGVMAPQMEKAKNGWFKKQQQIEAAAPASGYQPYLPNQNVPASQQKGGFFANLFKGKSSSAAMPPPADYAQGSTAYGMQPREVLPMSSPQGQPAPQMRPLQQPQVAPQPLPQVRGPIPTATPYRVQFGAFRRPANAGELSQTLGSAGIPTSVVQSSATGLNLVVTKGSFRTAEEAQAWIDYEGHRRGWQDRPVVIR